MKILAIRLARFGDIVLLLPALSYLKTQLPGSHLTFLTDERWGALPAMCPAIDEVITINRIGMRDGSAWGALHEIGKMVRGLRSQKFDLAIDCHGFRETNLIAFASGARKRLGLKRFDQSFLPFCFNQPPVLEDKGLHVSTMFLTLAQSVAPLSSTPVSSVCSIVVPPSAAAWAQQNLPPSPYVVLNIDAPVPERIWPEERFAALSRRILRDWNASVVVISRSPQTASDFGEGVRILSGLSIPQLAAVIDSARVLVSNDTGPMHLGPALGVPTVGIFSVGFTEHFCPTGPNDLVVRGNPIDRIQLEEVIEAANRLWVATTR